MTRGPVYLVAGRGRRALRLGPLLGEGAVGQVFTLPDMPGKAAKLYLDTTRRAGHAAKIDAMLRRPPELPALNHGAESCPQIAWPEEKLFDGAGRFVGFTMAEIDFRRSTGLVNMLQKNSRRIENIPEYYGYRILVARNLAAVIAELHRAGHHMIDMKPANLRFYPATCWMAVVDTDGFSIAAPGGRIPAGQVSDEYIAPESWRRPPAALGEEQDRFALAVILFQLLDNGVHPFAGGMRGHGGQASDLQSRIRQGLYPYALAPRPELVPSTASVHRMFPRATREMFDRAFLPGRTRPDAAQWRDHLDILVAQLQPCSEKPGAHAHFGTGCGFCGHDARVAATVQAARTAPRRRVDPAPARAPLPHARVPLRGGHGPVPHGVAQGVYATRHSGPPPGVPMPPAGRKRPLLRNVLFVSGAGVLLCAALLFLSEQQRQGLAESGAALMDAAAATVTGADPAEEKTSGAPIVTFEQGRAFTILPAGGARSVALRGGPGEQYALLGELSANENVVGRGQSIGADGSSWIWVERARDGAMGFVPRTALLERSAALEDFLADTAGCDRLEPRTARIRCLDPELASQEQRIEGRFEQLLSLTRGGTRQQIETAHAEWVRERDRCGDGAGDLNCRRAVNDAMSDGLDRWIHARVLRGGHDGSAF